MSEIAEILLVSATASEMTEEFIRHLCCCWKCTFTIPDKKKKILAVQTTFLACFSLKRPHYVNNNFTKSHMFSKSTLEKHQAWYRQVLQEHDILPAWTKSPELSITLREYASKCRTFMLKVNIKFSEEQLRLSTQQHHNRYEQIIWFHIVKHVDN